MSRKEITKALNKAATYYWVKKTYSVYEEIGLVKRGRMRADLVAFNMKKDFIIVEVKSGWSDYTSDTKWINYLPFCNRMYFCIHYKLWESKRGKQIAKDTKPHGVGIMVLGEDGRVSVKQSAKKKAVDSNFKEWLLIKMAWRGGNSRHNIKRIQKVFI